MDDQMSPSEQNRLSRRRRKQGEGGSPMIGGSVKHTYLVGQQINKRAEQDAAGLVKPKTNKRSRKKKSSFGCATFLWTE